LAFIEGAKPRDEIECALVIQMACTHSAAMAVGHRSVVRGGAHSQCGAKTRAGTACQSPPVPGRKRCQLHGGLSPGAPGGSRNGNYRRGDWTSEAIEERRWLRSLVQAFAKTGTGR
jgi:hypothetical protein